MTNFELDAPEAVNFDYPLRAVEELVQRERQPADVGVVGLDRLRGSSTGVILPAWP
jgi:hypothetical protein